MRVRARVEAAHDEGVDLPLPQELGELGHQPAMQDRLAARGVEGDVEEEALRADLVGVGVGVGVGIGVGVGVGAGAGVGVGVGVAVGLGMRRG